MQITPTQITVYLFMFLSVALFATSLSYYKNYKDEIKRVKELEKLLKEYKQNPDRSLHILHDLLHNEDIVLSVRRVDPSEIFLRSPKES